MSYELTGKIKLIQDEQTFASGFTKREMVVTVDDGRYPLRRQSGVREGQ